MGSIETNPFSIDALKSLVVRPQEPQPHRDFGYLLSHSTKMRKILRLITRAAFSDLTILITGETGTGKELVARTLQARSLRNNKPFIKLFCAALPESLIESEFFGYEKGAFTGAERRKLGKFDYAHQGTIFLDEIGELPFSVQGKLLQVLQGGVFSRIGGKTEVKVDVRVVVTTRKSLRKEIEKGFFREDLFYRLNEVEINLPPLRTRKEEIPFWVNVFIQKFNLCFNKKMSGISYDLMKRFLDHEWPGNLRELENCIQEIVVLNSEKGVFRKLNALRGNRQKSLSSKVFGHSKWKNQDFLPGKTSLLPHNYPRLKEVGKQATRKAERELIWLTLHRTHGDRIKTARLLEINYSTLARKISEYCLERN